MRKCCFFDILFLYCFPSFVNRVMSTDYQIVTALHWNIVNKEYYDFNPFQVDLIKKGYGYQTYYIAKSEYYEGKRYIRFSRGENNGVKVEVGIYNFL